MSLSNTTTTTIIIIIITIATNTTKPTLSLLWSRLNAPVELSTRYRPLQTTVEIGSTSANGE